MARVSYYATPLLRSLVHRPQGVILVVPIMKRGMERACMELLRFVLPHLFAWAYPPLGKVGKLSPPGF